MVNIGDIVYVHGHHSLADDAIKLGEVFEDHTSFKTNYVHVCIYIGNGQVAEAQGGRLSGPAPFSEYTKICNIGHFDWTKDQQEKIVQVAQKLYGLKYNWTEIAEIGIENLTDIELPNIHLHQFICSEYVKRVIKESTGVLLSEKRFTTPEDVSLYPNQRITDG